MSDHAYPDALPPQYRLHWYVLERVLGQGGFGITYLARDTNLDQQVAIKEYLPVEVATRRADSTVRPRTDDQGDRYRWGLDRFLREARTLARFDHPNIVRVLSVFEFNGTAYMVMRFEEGENFAAQIERRRTLPEAELMRVLLPVLDGLELIHNAGFIHRDIKPDNIHIRADGSPVLLDFGSARGSLGQGRTVTILVAPGYAPFEQYYSSGENQGPWTDIYGLGATGYRAIAGVPPLDAITRSKGVLGSAREVLIPARTIGAGRYSERVLQAIDHALEFVEKDRPQTIAEWRRELHEGASDAKPAIRPPATVAATASSVAPAQPAPALTASRPPANRVLVAAGFVAVAALGGALGAYFVTKGTESTGSAVSAAPPATATTAITTTPAAQPAVAVVTVPSPVSGPAVPPVVQQDPQPAAPQADPASNELTKPNAPAPITAKPSEDRAPAQRTTPPAPDKNAKAKIPTHKKATPPPPPVERVVPTATTKPAENEEKVAVVPPQGPALNPPPGDKAAFEYYLQYAHRGNAEATLKVAESYESGRGVAQNSVWACGWYELAVRRGMAAARDRKNAVTLKLQPRERKQCQDMADGQAAASG